MLAKEQLTQQEKDKLEIDPDFDFREIAARPFSDLSTNEIGMFKWSGVYHQLQKGYFMIRLRMPGGILTSKQLRRAGELAKSYAQDKLCITTRQCLQFHWVRKNDIYKIIEGMKAEGVLVTNACGDVVRNVTACPGAGVCRFEEGNTLEIVKEIADDPESLEKQRNLPRKHKITVAGCDRACGHALMNCQGWAPSGGDDRPPGWCYYAGGGLGRHPYLGRKIFSYVPENLVKHVTRAGIEVHNRYGNRRDRTLARLKIIVDRNGQKGYAELILGILRENGVEGIEAIEIAKNEIPEVKPMPFPGEFCVAEKEKGKRSVRIMIDRSEFSSDEAADFADFAQSYGNGEVIFTQRQNIELRSVPEEKADELISELRNAGYRLEGLEHIPDIVACVGTTVCNLAVSDTPAAYHQLIETLGKDEEFWKSVGPVRINMNGCPNSCGHHWIADVGLRGCRLKLENGGSEEGFTVHVGGALDGAGGIGKPVCKISAHHLPETLRELFQLYLDERNEKEIFEEYVKRLTPESIKEKLKNTLKKGTAVALLNLSLTDTFENVLKETQK